MASSLQKLLSSVSVTEAKCTEKTRQLTEADNLILDRRRELDAIRQQVIAIESEKPRWPTGSGKSRLLGASAILFSSSRVLSCERNFNVLWLYLRLKHAYKVKFYWNSTVVQYNRLKLNSAHWFLAHLHRHWKNDLNAITNAWENMDSNWYYLIIC